MKITANTALGAIQGLISINATGKVPLQLSIDISHNMRELRLIEDAVNARRQELVKQYGQEITNEEGNKSTVIPAESVDDFNKGQVDLMTEEVEINGRQIKATSFPDGFDIEPLALVALEWMILEE